MNWINDLQKLDPERLDMLDISELAQPWDDNPDIADPVADPTRQLAGDRTYHRTPSARTFHDFRSNPEAFRHMERLPTDGESMHGVISGRYALFDLVPAIMERSGQTINNLTLATLSYSAANAAEILGLFDARKIGAITLLVSHYFKGTSPHLWGALVPQLVERKQRVLAFRTHAKIILMELADGTKYVAESSANLRSCKNVEQFVLTRDNGLHAFHAAWITEVIDAGISK